ncbi:FluC/FEX family fluoride channel [Pseudolysinimonas sp.]|uniref:FluC/FEX family fluoride channel n=1 Tax=Pseudolysinimonas sp. TaxID=2680009 RepID=UPI003F7CE34D
MIVVLLTLAAGAVGALLRYGATHLAGRSRSRLPWAVFAVNAVGCAIGGTVLGLVDAGAIGPDVRLIVLGGLAGGLTTFSTWSTETIQLAMSRRWPLALVNVLANLVVGVAAVVVADLVVRALA